MTEQSGSHGEMDRVRLMFKEHGLRCTRQREVIYTALAATKAHPTAEELYGMVQELESGLSLATVYNTLDTFSDTGLCRRLPSPVGNGPCRYDADTSPHVHVRLGNDKVVDVPGDLGKELLDAIPQAVIDKIERRLGINVSDVAIEFVTRDGTS